VTRCQLPDGSDLGTAKLTLTFLAAFGLSVSFFGAIRASSTALVIVPSGDASSVRPTGPLAGTLPVFCRDTVAFAFVPAVIVLPSRFDAIVPVRSGSWTL